VYAGLLGIDVADAAELNRKVMQGLRYAALEHLREALGLTLAQTAELVMIQPRTLARRKVEGKLAVEESDRVARAARVFQRAVDLFDGDQPAARRWMASPARALAGRTPLDVARTDGGAREVEALIGRVEHGVFG
jgi:putative toxin-antitoxin system antitoxin component (TIGR02293 family)